MATTPAFVGHIGTESVETLEMLSVIGIQRLGGDLPTPRNVR